MKSKTTDELIIRKGKQYLVCYSKITGDLKWSMYNDNTWRKSNRFGGIVLMLTGAAIILTALAAVLTVVFFTGGHVFWGIVFALITIDFCADLVLAFKRT